MSGRYHMPFARVPADMCDNADHAGVYIKVDAVVALLAHEAEQETRSAGRRDAREPWVSPRAVHRYAVRRLSMLGEDIALGAARFEGAADGRL